MYDGVMNSRSYTFITMTVLGAAWLVAGAPGCAATEETSEFSGGSESTTSGGGQSSGSESTGTGQAGFTPSGTGGNGGSGGVPIDPCDSQCGDTELCENVPTALDDDCDGEVDEGCSCTAGTARGCFKGDPSYLNDAGCYAGTMKCNELGMWGPCEGGVHATDMCFSNSQGCHPIDSRPFVSVDLKSGTGSFSMDAVSESWTVACPTGVNPCPAVMGQNFQPLQSGEYTVTYDKTTSNGMDSCTYPLFVGAPGLRVELEWEHNLGGSGVDLDLHVHKPADVSPWGGDGGTMEDCAWDNCTALDFLFGGPTWFSGTMPPQPMNWWLDPVMENNTCYYGPKGSGSDWQFVGMGCHNPRLDVDNITCDPNVTDPADYNFCTPENINIDFPPNDQWTRIGVHYYSAHGLTYDVHPTVKIYCHGRLAAELGSTGYNAPVTFQPADGSTRFWLVADVLFRADECSDQACYVEPIYHDPNTQTPLLTDVSIVQQSYGPSYPPIPSP